MNRLVKRKLANRLARALQKGKPAEKAELDIFLRSLIHTFGITLRAERPAEIFRTLLYACHEDCSISMALKKLSLDERVEVYSNKTVLDALASIPSEIVTIFAQDMRAIMIKAAIQIGLNPTKVVIAIDDHNIPFYGDRNTTGVVGTKRKNSTNYAYQFLTASIVMEGARFTLGVIPRGPLTLQTRALRCLLEHIRALGVHVGLVLLDKGFNGTSFQDVLVSHFWVMPLQSNTKLAALVNGMHLQEGVLHDFEYIFHEHRAEEYRRQVRVIAKKTQNGDTHLFMTNIRELSARVLKLIIGVYSFRFGIETSYRVKNGFRPLTTSQRYEIRCWLVQIAFLCMDFWVLVNWWLLAKKGYVPRNVEAGEGVVGVLEAWAMTGFEIDLEIEAERYCDRVNRAVLNELHCGVS